jgi:prepilin-type N-terminal cleavage/methylation domain-containing protein
MRARQQGFSLVELLIVIIILGIILVISVPSILSSRRAANEGSTIASLRTLHGAQATYHGSTGAGNYAGTESDNGDTAGLSLLASEHMVDPVLGTGFKSGYVILGAVQASSSTSPATFFFSANPVSSSGVTQSGTRRFSVTQAGIIGAEYSDLATRYTGVTAPLAPPLVN